MKRIIVLLLALTVSAAALAATVPAASAAAPEEYLRGMWVSTAANLDYPAAPTTNADTLRAQADSILDSCAELGINAIFLQVRPGCDAIYPSRLYPYSAYLTGEQGAAPSDGFDPLSYWIDGAHSRGMELHAWINPYRVSTDASARLSPDSPAALHPEWVRAYKGAKYFDPGLDEVREYVIKGIKELISSYELDGIHFDDYFYPGKDFPDDEAYARYGNGADRGDWRRSNTETLVREAGEAARAAKIRFGVSPGGIWANKGTMPGGSDTSGASAYFDLYADTLKWAKEELVDYIAPQIYWYNGYKPADYAVLTKWWSEKLKDCGTELYIGLGDYRAQQYGADASSPWYGGDEIIRQMRMNSENDKISGEIHFRYGCVADNGLLYDKIKAFYSENKPQNADGKMESGESGECIYIYFDKRGNPLLVKKDKRGFDAARCRAGAAAGSKYCRCVSFKDKKAKVRRVGFN